MQKYGVNQSLIRNILSWVEQGEIFIPEIQRPFVWDTVKIRDLMDSLYKGYPVGYVITWKNPDVRGKDGSISAGKKILIDGQQRITALRAAILGEEIIDRHYKKIRPKISFHPLREEFATHTPAIERDVKWLPDIAAIMKQDGLMVQVIQDYCTKNPEVDRSLVERTITSLVDIRNKQVGFIDLDESLDTDTVTEIFIRINSKGVPLSQTDFVMSKIASHGELGVNLRKLIDSFAHIARDSSYFQHISDNDKEFAATPLLQSIAWLRKESDDLYDPDYRDIIRVCFTKEFKRGKISELVGLLSGRNFETRTFEKSIVDDTYSRLQESVLDFVNETHFKRFLMIIKSSGFINNRLINSQNTLNAAYIVYLTLRAAKHNESEISRLVQRWFVMSVLTGRYSGSSESTFDSDIRGIDRDGVAKHLETIETAELSETFWTVRVVQELEKSSMSNPFIQLYFAAQIKSNKKGFLSRDITVRNLIEHRGDIHHLFPVDYLKAKYARQDYNQIANYVYAQQEINIKIGKKSPRDYFAEIKRQCSGEPMKYGSITDIKDLKSNLRSHAIPEAIMEMDLRDYPGFLEQRRKLMAKQIEQYYKKL